MLLTADVLQELTYPPPMQFSRIVVVPALYDVHYVKSDRPSTAYCLYHASILLNTRSMSAAVAAGESAPVPQESG